MAHTPKLATAATATAEAHRPRRGTTYLALNVLLTPDQRHAIALVMRQPADGGQPVGLLAALGALGLTPYALQSAVDADLAAGRTVEAGPCRRRGSELRLEHRRRQLRKNSGGYV